MQLKEGTPLSLGGIKSAHLVVLGVEYTPAGLSLFFAPQKKVAGHLPAIKFQLSRVRSPPSGARHFKATESGRHYNVLSFEINARSPAAPKNSP